MRGAGRATLTCAAGPSELDGPVDVVVVAEEPGTGLGARLAGLDHDDPGPEVGTGPPGVRIKVESQAVPLWLVSISTGDGEQDRSVLAGEAQGRWLWLVLRPASAILMLREDWILRDVSRIGAAAARDAVRRRRAALVSRRRQPVGRPRAAVSRSGPGTG